jgi:GMP synthase-like glutamine amidotransferase
VDAPPGDPVAAPPRLRIGLTVTEHSSRLDEAARASHESFARVLAEAGDVEVTCSHYLAPDLEVDALVLSGSGAPWAAHDPADIDRLGERVRGFDGPVLGICAGMQLLALFAGGRVDHLPLDRPERGWSIVEVLEPDGLLAGLGDRAVVHQDHTDEVTELPSEFALLATSAGCRVQAIASRRRRWWGTQFHPELHDAEHPAGRRILGSFLREAATAGGERPGPGPSAPARATRVRP